MRASHAASGFAIALGALLVVPHAFAHHSFAPHFDSSKPAPTVSAARIPTFDEYASNDESRLWTIRYYTALLNAKAGRTNEAMSDLQALNKEMAQDGASGSLHQAVLATLKQLRSR